MPPSVFDIDAVPALAKLRALGTLADIPIGQLIGAGDVPPMVVEVRMAPVGDGWLWRAQETGGQWLPMPGSAWCRYEDVKEKLSTEMPLHRCEWWESEGEYDWQDC